MDEPKSIMRMSPAEGAELAEKAVGSPAAARTFLFYSAWRTIQLDKAIPVKKKPTLLREIMKTVEVVVES